MNGRAKIVLDVGKTLTKLSLWSPEGRLITQSQRANDRIEARGYIALDAPGIEAFLSETLQSFARLADIDAIIPVGHGAAAAVIDDDGLVLPPLDYEYAIPAPVRHAYRQERDAFALTGSPLLPDGLNLGMQLFFLEWTFPDLFSAKRRIVPWAQYWSWLLSGVAASEVTSLGCHTDLWHPPTQEPSDLATRRGWHARIAPRQDADAVLGTICAEWAERTHLARDVRIYCGLHDSNAALIAARAFPEIADREATVLSTGTWFVGMRSPAPRETLEIVSLDETRDCLVNVDTSGRPVPSARFMGGREIELLTGLDTRRIDIRPDQPTLLASVRHVLASQAMVLPAFVSGCGPYPNSRGRWLSMPTDETQRRAAVALYAALVADAALQQIGARDRLLIEGRFSESEVFVRAMAALRSDAQVYVCHSRSDVSFGALRLMNPTLGPSSALVRVQPLAEDLSAYADKWRHEAADLQSPAQPHDHTALRK